MHDPITIVEDYLATLELGLTAKKAVEEVAGRHISDPSIDDPWGATLQRIKRTLKNADAETLERLGIEDPADVILSQDR